MKNQNLLCLSLLLPLLLIGCQSKPEVTIVSSTEQSKTTLSNTKESEEASTFSTTSSDLSYIQKNPIQEYLDTFKNQKIGIFIENTSTNETYGVNEEQVFYGASIAKLPIIWYTQEALKNGTVQKETPLSYLDEVNNIPGAMIRGGTGVMQYQIDQQNSYSVETLLEWTIKHSDNLASNTLGYYLAEQNGDEFMSSIKPFYTFEQSTFTKNMNAHTAVNLMKAIYDNQLGIDYFLETDWVNEKIDILDKPVYHKIGTNDGFNHDVAYVDGENPYVISVLTEDFSNSDIELIVKEIDKLIVEE